MDASVSIEEIHGAEEVFSRETFDVWFEADSSYRPAGLKRWIAELLTPEFEVDGVEESARIEDDEGNRRAHWHCRCTARQEVDEFAALRALKLLTAAGFRLLRFDAGDPVALQAGYGFKRRAQSLQRLRIAQSS